MSRVRRIYAEKRPGYDVAARQLCQELREALGTEAISHVRIFQRYDVEGLSDAAFESARGIIFSEPNADTLYDETLPQLDAQLLAVEYLPGQYDQRADSAAQCLQLLSPEQAKPKVACAKVYAIEGNGVTGEMMEAIAHHVINPVEARRASMEKPETLEMQADVPADVAVIEGFTQMNDKALGEMVARMGMAMSAEDLCFCRDYFRDTEKRDPSVTELRAIDTYWSDHCRHTTFLTAIDEITFDDGRFAAPVKAAYELYVETRKDVYGARQKDISLMDMATLGAKALRRMGKLDDLDASDEINACSIVVTANVDGRDEPWLIMFKNETHNHPTEIEGFGGAATCLGGAIRDPLSGRSYVYQAMRITGSGDPRVPYSRTRAGKLPQRRITTTAALMSHGYDPDLSTWSPFHGAVYAVTESLAKICAAGGDVSRARLTFQEYFERLNRNKLSWGKPAAALLGGLSAQLGFGTASIGGKDSMSGTFEDIHVPPTLVSFAVGMVDARNVVSTDLKGAEGHRLALLTLPVDDALVPEYDKALMLYESLHQAILRGDVLSAHTVGRGGIAAAVTMMAMGSRIGVKLTDVAEEELFLPAYGGIVVELKPGAPVPAGLREIGVTTESATLSACGMTLSLSEAHGAWSEPLESVFPTEAKAKHTTAPFIPYETRSAARPKLQIAKPRVFIPSFPGTNCELDSEKAFRRAGAETDVFVFRNLTAKGIEESVEALVRGINAAQIVMLPGGFSAGDEPDGSGKFIATALRNPRIMEAIMNLLNQRDGLMLGICNGFQALIKLGLVPYGEIRTIREDDPTLTYNTIGRHAATHVRTVVSSVKSPWMAGVNVGDVHQVAISHGEGRFVCREAQLKQLVANGQIVTQYCTIDGVPAVKMPENPNGSYWAVEGICSPDGRVLGKMGHSERIGANVARNIPGEKDQKIFESGVAYFG